MSLIVKYYCCCFIIILGSLQSTMIICCCYGMTVSSSSKPSKLSLESMFESGLLVQPVPNLYILGTVHIGSKSAEEVEYLIEKIQPSHIILEIPPSRLQQKQKLQRQQQQQILSPTAKQQQQQNRRRINLWQSLGILPDLAYEGYMNGGISGMLFTTTIVGSSLIKLSMTSKQEEELPRRNEFEAAIDAVANNKIEGVVNMIGADLEFDDLIYKVSKSMTLDAWIRLAILTIQQNIGLLMEKDPIRRQHNESMIEWEIRRRNINTARSSSLFSKTNTPELHQVLVEDRDIEFANICLGVANATTTENKNGIDDDGDNDDDDANTDRRANVVCIVGLVHLDGIVDNIISSS